MRPALRPLALVLALLAALLAPAFAQAPAPVPAPAGPAADTTPIARDLEALIGTLENDAERARLVKQLRTLLDAQQAKREADVLPDRVMTRFLLSLSEGVADIGAAIYDAAAFLTDTPKLFAWIGRQATDTDSRARLLEIAVKLALALAGAWLAEFLAFRVLRPAQRRIEETAQRLDPSTPRWRRMGPAGLNAIVQFLPVLAFAGTGLAVLTISEPSRPARLLTLAVINAAALVRLIRLAATVLLSPAAPALRPLAIGDETAGYAELWIRRLATLAVYGWFASEAVLLLDLPRGGHALLLKSLGLVIGLLLAGLILQNRQDVAALLAGKPDGAANGVTTLRARLASYWHLVAIAYVALLVTIWIVQPGDGFAFTARASIMTLAIAGAATAVLRLGRRFVLRHFSPSAEMLRRFPGLEARANRYLTALGPLATLAVYGVAGLAILQVWGLRSLDWLATPFGQRLATGGIAVATTLIVAVLLWEIASLALERYFLRSFGRNMDEWRRMARVRTLMPMVQRVIAVILVAFVGLVLLSELGVNITPLLALSGAVGIAVGLGAQDLVKDVIAGGAILIEDSIAIGDVVQLGEKSGVVEWMSIRALRLRAFDGTLHTIPFSEFKTISNMTKDFAFAVFDIGVGYGADTDRVTQILREEGAALRQDAAIGPQILDDLEVLGIDRFADSAVMIKARFRTRPIQQWTVTRAFNRRIKLAFEREGIEIPFPQRTVHVVGPAPQPGPAAGAASG
ncbi:MAG: mechanosensitive ion channel [Alphaproteobacteria bacterium]|nr:mechanosensitive ion channel [Alphaproteobacteria bacterium]